MTTKIADRVKESITTTGTGNILSLGGAESGFQSFSDAGFRDGDTFSYVIEDGSNYEYGEAIYGWNMTQAAYNEKSFSPASAGASYGNNHHFAFGNSGTKIYTTSTTSDTVYQFSLSTAYDISTASYDSVSLSLSGLGDPRIVMFKPDGTKLFVHTNASPSALREYDLSTAWDLSSASAGDIFHVSFSNVPYDSPSFGSCQNMHFSSDGLTLLASNISCLFEYDLSVAYDLNTAKGYNFTSSYSNPIIYPDNFIYYGGIPPVHPSISYAGGFSEDGKNYIYMNTSRNGVSPTYNNRYSGQIKLIQQSKISHIQTCGSASKFYRGSLTPSSITGNINEGALVLADNGAYAHDVWGGVIYQAETGLTYGANKITRITKKSSNSDNPIDLSGNAKIFVSVTEDEIKQAKVGVTASYARRFYTRSSLQLGTGDTFILPRDGTLTRLLSVETERKSNGYPSDTQRDYPTTVNIITNGTSDYYSRRLDDIDNSSYTQSYTLNSTLEKGLWMNYDGTYMYTVYNGASIYQYTLSTAFDLTTASYTRSFTPSISSMTGVCFNPEGTKMFIVGASTLYERSLSTAWDISTASTSGSSGSLYSSTEYTSPQFSNDGNYFYVTRHYSSSSWSSVYYYNYLVRFPMTTPWDISTISSSTMENGTSLVTGPANYRQVQSMYIAPDESGYFWYNNNTDYLAKYLNKKLDGFSIDTLGTWLQGVSMETVFPASVGDAYGMFVPEKNYNYIFFNNGSTIYRKYCGFKEHTASTVYAGDGYLFAPDGYALDVGQNQSRASLSVYDDTEGQDATYQNVKMALR